LAPLPAIAATLALVVVQIFAVASLVPAIAAKLAMVSATLMAIATELAAVVAHLARASIRAIVAELAAIDAAIAIVGTDVATIVAEVATVAAKIAPIVADIARIAANFTRPLEGRGGLCVRDGGTNYTKRQREAECDQVVAKHREILRGSVGTRPLHRAVRGGRRGRIAGVKGFP